MVKYIAGEFNPPDPQGRRRKVTSIYYPFTSTGMLSQHTHRHTHAHTHTHTHIHILTHAYTLTHDGGGRRGEEKKTKEIFGSAG